jgi:uncharacterized repeat protein (TIGR03803 family)
MKRILFISAVSILLSAVSVAQGVSKLFGLVGGGVQNNHTSNGFLFSTDSSGTDFQLKYSFPVTVFGSLPANLEMAPFGGKLYGTTTRGGVNDFGTIFEYDPATNIYIKKFDFGPNASVTGGSPKGSLLLYNNKFYGLAADYAVNGAGCIFEWDPATNIYTKKYDLIGSGGANPQNSLRLMNGKMYGTTVSGGSNNLGVVFEWDPATNAYKTLYELTGPNGWGFYCNVTPYNNKIYCMSHQGAANNYGALYVIDPSLPVGSNTTIIRHFDGTSGGTANNNEMIVVNNKLYGCVYQGGTNSGGTLFELNPSGNVFTKLVDFNYSTTGINPLGKLVPNGSKFLGICSGGGVNGTGTIFEWDPANPTAIIKKADFGPNNFDSPINPGSTLAFFNSKFYAVTYNGGFVNQGTLFEYNYTSNTLTKKLNFNAAENGRIPTGKPVLLNGILYGVCYQGPKEIFGTPYGCLWSFDPATNTYARKFLFDDANGAANGRAPNDAPVAYNNKLYGTTTNGGISDWGVFYEYDPVTNAYSKKDIQAIGGAYPIGAPTLYNNKFYGMTNAAGTGNSGIIYCYDPATGVLSKLYDVQNSGSVSPSGGFTVYNNKLYGTTQGGGANNTGAIIAYDPATNTATNVYSLAGATGISVVNPMTVYNNKLYGTAVSGGAGGRGCIFRFDPSNNSVTTVHSFIAAPGMLGYDPKGELTVSGDKLYCIMPDGNNVIQVIQYDPVTNNVTTRSSHTTTNSNLPVNHNGLTVLPAFIANGTPGSCESYPTVVIDATNTNKWVPILNAAGDVVAEIKANGNILGTVTASTYINNGAVREDALRQLYLDRNITINTQNPVTGSNVDIRLYIKTAEYLALKNATNSSGLPSGISAINDIAIVKNAQGCSAAMASGSTRLVTASSLYEYGYVLSASINSFSTFFFAKNSFATLPVRLLSFAAVQCSNNICLSWSVENEERFERYEVEKMISANTFSKIAETPSQGATGLRNYSTVDRQPINGDNFYRLKMIDIDGTFRYSNVVRVKMNSPIKISMQPNPASNVVVVSGVEGYQQIKLLDMFGKVHLQQLIRQPIEQLDISKLARGMYIVQLLKADETISLQLIKH